jgi:UDP-N-acetylmuramoyl-L-alanyl-D-glutamate--2,6-diaminopimelate ligase
VSIASVGDTVVVLGKGHEHGQEIAGEIIDFDDCRVLAASIAGAK